MESDHLQSTGEEIGMDCDKNFSQNDDSSTNDLSGLEDDNNKSPDTLTKEEL